MLCCHLGPTNTRAPAGPGRLGFGAGCQVGMLPPAPRTPKQNNNNGLEWSRLRYRDASSAARILRRRAASARRRRSLGFS